MPKACLGGNGSYLHFLPTASIISLRLSYLLSPSLSFPLRVILLRPAHRNANVYIANLRRNCVSSSAPISPISCRGYCKIFVALWPALSHLHTPPRHPDLCLSLLFSSDEVQRQRMPFLNKFWKSIAQKTIPPRQWNSPRLLSISFAVATTPMSMCTFYEYIYFLFLYCDTLSSPLPPFALAPIFCALPFYSSFCSPLILLLTALCLYRFLFHVCNSTVSWIFFQFYWIK